MQKSANYGAQTFPGAIAGAQIEAALQHVVLAQSPGENNEQSKDDPQIHETFANADRGATSDATIGSAITDARPIFLITSRLD